MSMELMHCLASLKETLLAGGLQQSKQCSHYQKDFAYQRDHLGDEEGSETSLIMRIIQFSASVI